LNQHPENRTAYFHMLWSALAFALMGAMSHAAGEDVPWQLVAAARAGVAFLLAAATARLLGARLAWSGPKALWLRSLSGSAGLFCSFYGMTHLPVADALTLMNTSALWVTLLSWLALGERLSLSVWLGVLLALAGVVCIQQPHFSGGKFACAVTLTGGLLTGVAMLGLNRLQNMDPRAVVAHFSGVSGLATALFFTFTAGPSARFPAPKALWLLFGVGVLGALGQYGMTLAYTHGHAPRVAATALSQVLFALILDVAIWKRPLNAVSLLGMALVVSPTAWLMLDKGWKTKGDLAESSMA
jgi:drug/metabolite transporter (DMT)-like permease